ncbi:hypothetical protein C9F11_40880 [Streptomyces sp. YIM 121038]|nr:hypothetical protein C9F11_40880 [Streptomyces sp. YIM 121038]
MGRLRIQVSGCLRTLQGAQDLAAIRTYLATLARHDQPLLAVHVQAMRGSPWTPATARSHRPRRPAIKHAFLR